MSTEDRIAPEAVERSRPLVVGIGNRFRRDDGVAAAVLDELADWADRSDVDVMELDGEPTRLVDAWADRGRVVLLDAAAGGGAEPGEVLVVAGGDIGSVQRGVVSGHSAGAGEAVSLAAVLGRMPEELTLVCVVGSDFSDGDGLTPAVEASIGPAAAAVRSLLTDSATEAAPDRGVVGGVADVPR